VRSSRASTPWVEPWAREDRPLHAHVAEVTTPKRRESTLPFGGFLTLRTTDQLAQLQAEAQTEPVLQMSHRLARVFCTAFACALLGLLAAPAAALRISAPTEQCVASASELAQDAVPELETVEETVSTRSVVVVSTRLVARERPLAVDHFVRVPDLYLRHCSLLC